MKKIGLILQGETAQIFLEKLRTQYHSSNFYTIITPEAELIPQTYPNHFDFHHFDPTSFSKLTKALNFDPHCVFLIYEDLQEGQIIYALLKENFPNTTIIYPTHQNQKNTDPLLEEVSIPIVIANKLLTYLPNIPTPIQDIGLGKGEIMEIPIPTGSVYCYRTLGSIAQEQWKIAGVYRNEELLLAIDSLILQPNDKLLALGNPKILSNTYRQITSSLGQFPIPFGNDLYLYLDEDCLSQEEILQDLDEALFLHKHLNAHQLIITLLNPKRFELISHLKAIQSQYVDVFLDFQNLSLAEILHTHHNKKIGLAIINHKLFHHLETKKTLFELSIPTFKTAKMRIEDCTSSLTLLEREDIASITLDIASQLKLDFEIYDFDVDGNFHLDRLESYKTLSHIFEKPIHYIQSSTKNPVIYLIELNIPILQFLPLNLQVVTEKLLRITSTHPSYHSAHSNKHPQILIPSL